MYDAVPASAQGPRPLAMQRVDGVARIRFARSGGKTRLDDLFQSGAAKIRLPRVYGAPPTAVLLNTAGGLTGGDRLGYDIDVESDAHAIVTSQTAERAYRSSDGTANVRVTLQAGQASTLEWLPQETILFDRSRLKRTVTADLHATARLMLLETVVLGRTAMGEQVNSVFFKDSWRIRHDGNLVFADDIRLDGNPAEILAGPATGNGKHVFATFADCVPDAEDRLNFARSCLEGIPENTTRAATSAWNGMLVARFVSSDSRDLRTTLMSFLTRYRAAELPRVWHC
ncbi:urease accessory protein UreD [Roseibium sp.]|uniref:urease accessory protein UreD n=1 Tax=Roseibium sp. TaxID=1936156 RepID=UPI0039EECDDF